MYQKQFTEETSHQGKFALRLIVAGEKGELKRVSKENVANALAEALGVFKEETFSNIQAFGPGLKSVYLRQPDALVQIANAGFITQQEAIALRCLLTGEDAEGLMQAQEESPLAALFEGTIPDADPYAAVEGIALLRKHALLRDQATDRGWRGVTPQGFTFLYSQKTQGWTLRYGNQRRRWNDDASFVEDIEPLLS